ncbi:protein O-mannose kinase [Lampetra planeri]
MGAARLLLLLLAVIFTRRGQQEAPRAGGAAAGCPRGAFRLPGMARCEPLLGCTEIRGAVRPRGLLGQGAVKQVHLAEWRGLTVALARLRDPRYRADMRHGVAMLRGLQGPHVVQLVGVCEEDDAFVAEHHALGALHTAERVLQGHGWRTRMEVAMSYVEVLAYLHESPLGTRVMCDSNDLAKTLSQFLLTSELRAVASDLDALPRVDRGAGRLATCGHRQLGGDFVAPEQRWPYDDRPFDESAMPGYDEKSDVWKVPDVTDFLLGAARGSDVARFHLFGVHGRCKEREPALRPSAGELGRTYRALLAELEHEEL